MVSQYTTTLNKKMRKEKEFTFKVGAIDRTTAMNQPRRRGRQSLLYLQFIGAALAQIGAAQRMQRVLVQTVARTEERIGQNRRDRTHRGESQRGGVGACHSCEEVNPVPHVLLRVRE